MKRVLIIDDDIAVTNYFMVFLVQTGMFEPEIVNDSRQVPVILEKEAFDVIILDMDMPDLTGLDILNILKRMGNTTPVIVLTGVSDVKMAVEAMKSGAFDYLLKPVDDEKFLGIIQKAIEFSVSREKMDRNEEEWTLEKLKHRSVFNRIPTRNINMIKLFHGIETQADGDLPLLIQGEAGTPVNDLARIIHDISPRRDNSFICIDAASKAPSDFVIDLFGQDMDWRGQRKSSSGALLEGENGTVLIMNIDCIPIPYQERIKNIIQGKLYHRENSAEVISTSARIITATALDLSMESNRESFSQDLLYHIMPNMITVPPLNERLDDLPLLVEKIVLEYRGGDDKHLKGVSPEAMKIINAYNFPENDFELESILREACSLESSNEISLSTLLDSILKKTDLKVGKRNFQPRLLKDVIWETIQKTLEYYSHDIPGTAESLGIEIEELYGIMEANGEKLK